MDFIYIGEIVNTHGIKGEVRITSNFKYRDLIFKKGFNLYIGYFKDELKINTYRYHKVYDMVTFEGINDINDVICYKGDSVYINRADLKIDGYLNEDLIGMEVYIEKRYIGKVDSIITTKAHEILVVKKDQIKNLIPNIDEFILNVDLDNHKILVKEIEGLIHED